MAASIFNLQSTICNASGLDVPKLPEIGCLSLVPPAFVSSNSSISYIYPTVGTLEHGWILGLAGGGVKWPTGRRIWNRHPKRG